MSLRIAKTGSSRKKPDVNPDRPPIWADGSQRPPFELRVLLRSGLSRGTGYALALLDGGADHFGSGVTGRICNRAARIIRNDDAPDATELTAVLASSFLSARAPAPVQTNATSRQTEDQTLAAIRAAIIADGHKQPTSRQTTLPQDEFPAVSEPGMLTRTSGLIVAGFAMISLVPAGLASALFAHFAGEDLRQTP